MITDRDFLRAERDYLTPPEDRDPVCDHCGEVELHDLDNADASVTAALGCASDAALCPCCRDIGAADAAKLAAERDAWRAAEDAARDLAARWRARSGDPSWGHQLAVCSAMVDAIGSAAREVRA